LRQVAKQFRVSLSTVQLWVERAANQRLDRVDWSDRSPGRREPVNKTPKEMEDLVLTIRRELKEVSALGEYGAQAICDELQRRRIKPLPSLRTIGRILERQGALDGRKRTRRPAPPVGWYLPKVRSGRAELDSLDIVEGLVIQGGYGVEVLNAISLHGGLPASWPRAKITAKTVVNALIGHWQQFGLPDFAQFDNDTVFQGPHHHPDTIGRVTRLCLSLNVVAVFAPPRETGFQASVENFNGRWQAKVWSRFRFETRNALGAQSAKFITACRRRSAARIDGAPPRRPFPKGWIIDLQNIRTGKIVYLRRTSDKGQVNVLGHSFAVDANWPHRLVRVEVDIKHNRIRFYALRRREPDYQPLLAEVSYQLPKRRFNE
jgi:putative transposase